MSWRTIGSWSRCANRTVNGSERIFQRSSSKRRSGNGGSAHRGCSSRMPASPREKAGQKRMRHGSPRSRKKFLAQSRKAQNTVERERRQARWIKRLALAAAAVAVIAIAATFFAHHQWQEADQQTRNAQIAQQRAENESAKLLEERASGALIAAQYRDQGETALKATDHLYSWLYTLSALLRTQNPLPESVGRLFVEPLRPRESPPVVLPMPLENDWEVTDSALCAEDRPVVMVSRVVAGTSRTESTLRDWDPASESWRLRRSLENDESISAMACGHDRIAFVLSEKAVVLREGEQEREIQLDKISTSGRFSPSRSALSQTHLALAGADGELLILPLSRFSEDQPGLPLPEPLALPDRDRVSALSFSANGDFLAVGSHSGMLTIWRQSSRQGEPWHRSGLEYRVKEELGIRAVALDPQGELLITCSKDGETVQVFHRDHGEVAIFHIHRDPVRNLAFDAGGLIVRSLHTNGRDSLRLRETDFSPKIFADRRNLRHVLTRTGDRELLQTLLEDSQRELDHEIVDGEIRPGEDAGDRTRQFYQAALGSFEVINPRDLILLRRTQHNLSAARGEIPDFPVLGENEILLVPDGVQKAAAAVFLKEDLPEKLYFRFRISNRVRRRSGGWISFHVSEGSCSLHQPGTVAGRWQAGVHPRYDRLRRPLQYL